MKAKVTVSADGRSAALELPWEAAVAEVLTRAQAELELAGDQWELYCADGTTMQNKLTRTLAELRDRRICPRLEFELRQPPTWRAP